MSGQAGLTPAPQQPQQAGLAAPTMVDRRALIQAMQAQGMSTQQILQQLQAQGLYTPATQEPVEEAFERPGFVENLAVGARGLGQMAMSAAGFGAEVLGYDEAGEDLRDAGQALFGLSDEEQARQQRAWDEGTLMQNAVTVAAQGAPSFAGAMAGGWVGGIAAAGAWGARAAGAIRTGQTLGSMGAMLPATLGSAREAAQAAFETGQGPDPRDPRVQAEIAVTAAARAVLEGIGPSVVEGAFARMATDSARRAVATGALRTAGVAGVAEGAANVLGNTLEMVVFDPEMRAALNDGEVSELAGLVRETYGDRVAADFVGGALLGGTFGGAAATIGQRRVNSQREEDVRTLGAAAEESGVSLDRLEAAARDPDEVHLIAAGAQRMGAIRREKLQADTQLQIALGTGDPEAVRAAQTRVADVLARANEVFDSTFVPLGGRSHSEVAAQVEIETQRAAENLTNEDLAPKDVRDRLPPTEVRQFASELEAAKQRLEDARYSAEGPESFNPQKRGELVEGLRKAERDFQTVRDRIAVKTGRHTEASLKAEKTRQIEAETYNTAVQRQYERKFGPLIDAGDPAKVRAEAEAIIKADKTNPDKGLTAEIRKLEHRLDRAQTPQEMDAIEQEIAQKRGRMGRRAPIVAAAQRALDTVKAQQAEAVQGSSPAAATTAAPATTGVTPAAQPVATAAAGTQTPTAAGPATGGAVVASPQAGTTAAGAVAPTTTPAATPKKAAKAPVADVPGIMRPTEPAQAEAFDRLAAANRDKLVGDPADAIAIAPHIIEQGRQHRERLGLDPNATPSELYAAGADRGVLGMERDVQNALGLPIDATPDAVAAALAARPVEAAAKPEAAKPKTLDAEAAKDRIATRNAEADRLSADNNPVRMTGGPGGALVSPSPDRPGAWRITYLDADGPSGHTDHADKRSAVLDAMTQGYTPDATPEAAPARTRAQAKAERAAEVEAETTQQRLDREYQGSKAPDFEASKRASSIAGDGSYQDMTDVFGRRTATRARALEFVREHGGKTGHEYAVAFDTETGEVLGAGTNGRPNMVNMSQATKKALLAGRAVTVIHNHPAGSSLSASDLQVMYSVPGDLTIVAAGPDGFEFTAKPTAAGRALVEKLGGSRNLFKGGTPDKPSVADMLNRALMSAVTAAIKEGTVELTPDQSIAPEDYRAIWQATTRAVNRALSNAGLTTYRETGVSPTMTRRQAAAFDNGVKHAGQAIRDAYALPAGRSSGATGSRSGNVQRPDAVRSGRSKAAGGRAGSARKAGRKTDASLAEQSGSPDGGAAQPVDGRGRGAGVGAAQSRPVRPGETVAGLTPVAAFTTPAGGTVFEVKAPQEFTRAAEAAKESMGAIGAQVGTDPGTRQFLFNDGQSGFALDGDNIISVFTTDGAPSGVLDAVFSVAIPEGGRRLDAFDTYLPRAYANRGFRAVARLPFSREYAPEGWDYDFFQQTYQNSDPDVVFMVHDPENASPTTDNTIGDYDEGIAAQQEALAGAALEEASGADWTPAPEQIRAGLAISRQYPWRDVSGDAPAVMDDAAADAFVLARGGTSVEYIVATKADGTVLAAGTNDHHAGVQGSEAMLYAHQNDIGPFRVTHNHPFKTPLSGLDLLTMLRSKSPETMVAVMPDGSTNTARKGPAAEGLTPRQLGEIVTAADDAAYTAVSKRGLESRKQTVAIAEARNRALERAGVIEYIWGGNGPGLGLGKRLENTVNGAADVATEAVERALRGSRDVGRSDEPAGSGGADGAGEAGRPDGPGGGVQEADADALAQAVSDAEALEESFMPQVRKSESLIAQALPGARMAINVPAWLDVQTDHGQAYRGMLDAAKNPRSTAERVFKFLEQQVVNSAAPIRDLELKVRGRLGDGMDSAFKSAEIATNDAGRNEALMFYGAGKLGENGDFTIAPGTIGIRKMLEKLGTGQSVVDWMTWMGARRAQEIRAKGLKTPLKDADIEAGLALDNPVFREVAADWKRFNDANVDFLVQTGRIGKAIAQTLKADAAYIPFYRSEDTVGNIPDLYDEAGIKRAAFNGAKIGTQILSRDPGIKRMKGGETRKVNNLIENMIRNSQAIVAAGMRNRAANLTFDMMADTGYVTMEPARRMVDGEWVSVAMPKDAVRMWRNGVESFVVPQTADAIPLIVAMGGLQPIRLTGIAKFMAQVGSFFRQSITLSPAFMIRNMIRDAVSTGVLFGGKNLTMENNAFTGMMKALNGSTSRLAYTTKSGMGDFRFGGGDVGLGSSDLMIEFGIQPKTLGFHFRQILGKMETLGTATELANRIAVMDALVAEGVRPDEAAYQALTIVNYGRRGANAALRSVLPMIPFLNARIQGLARLGEDAITKRGPERRKALARLALSGAVLSAASALLWAWNNDDEERRERYMAEPLHRRLNYHIIYVGDRTILIPKAFEIGTLFGTVPEMFMEAAVNQNTSELGTATLMTLANTFSFNPIPAAMLPALEVAADFNFFTGRPIEGPRLSNLMREDRISPQTSALAVGLARTGLANFAGLSPVAIDHLLAGYGGVAYTSLVTMTDTVAGEMGLIPARPEGVFGTIPVVSPALEMTFGSMFKDADSNTANRYVDDFYSTRTAITRIYRSAREAALTGDVERARQLLEAAPGTPAAYRLVNRAGTRIGELSSAMRRIRADPNLSASEKTEQLRPIIQERNRLSSQVMALIREMEEQQGTSFSRAAR